MLNCEVILNSNIETVGLIYQTGYEGIVWEFTQEIWYPRKSLDWGKLFVSYSCFWVCINVCIKNLTNINFNLIDFRSYNLHGSLHYNIQNILPGFYGFLKRYIFLLQHLADIAEALIQYFIIKIDSPDISITQTEIEEKQFFYKIIKNIWVKTDIYCSFCALLWIL